jgi:hypothetical protein
LSSWRRHGTHQTGRQEVVGTHDSVDSRALAITCPNEAVASGVVLDDNSPWRYNRAVSSVETRRNVVRWSTALGLVAVVVATIFIADADNGCGRGHLLAGPYYVALVILCSIAAVLACAAVVGTRARPRLWTWVLGILLALGVGGALFGFGVGMMWGDWACTG